MFKQYILNKASDSIIGTGVRIFLGKLSIEAYPFTKSFGVELALQDDFEHTLHFNLHIPLLFSLYISYDSKFLLGNNRMRNIVGYNYGRRESSLKVHHWCLWVDLWSAEDTYGTLGGKWRGLEYCFHIDDFFLGKIDYSTQVVKMGHTSITIPEGYGYEEKEYEGTWKKEVIIHKRSRWFTKKYPRYELEVEGGVPHPGKGTMSYNCEEGACYSLGGPYANLPDLKAKFIENIQDKRKNYPL